MSLCHLNCTGRILFGLIVHTRLTHSWTYECVNTHSYITGDGCGCKWCVGVGTYVFRCSVSLLRFVNAISSSRKYNG